jgi:8-oxo-dGTP diphosphatase
MKENLSWPFENVVNATPEQRAERTLNRIFGRRDDHGTDNFSNLVIASEIRNAIQETLTHPPKDAKPRYPVGVSILLVVGGRLLLGRRKNNQAAGMLSTPGGRLEPNESIVECANREFTEETGAYLGSGSICAEIYNVIRHNRFNDNYVMIYMLATAYEGRIENTEPDKCEGWDWYTGYDLEGHSDVTEPESILKYLPLARIRPAIEQSRLDKIIFMKD